MKSSPFNQRSRQSGIWPLVLVGILGSGVAGSFIWRSPAEPDAASSVTLDSFCEDSVAKTVLEQSADKLHQELLAAWGKNIAECCKYDAQYAAWLRRNGGISGEASRQKFAQKAGPRPLMDVDEWTERYRQAIGHLRVEAALQSLENDLLLLYRHDHHWRQWMGLYLDILERDPTHYDLAFEGAQALSLSEQFGHTAQIHDALEYIAQHSADLVARAAARRAISQWQHSTQCPEPPTNRDARLSARGDPTS